jgi:hypothetical protein
MANLLLPELQRQYNEHFNIWLQNAGKPLPPFTRWQKLKRTLFWAQYDLRSWLADWIAP